MTLFNLKDNTSSKEIGFKPHKSKYPQMSRADEVLHLKWHHWQKECKLLEAFQEMASSSIKLNDGCGIDYTEEYGYDIPSSHISSSY